MAAGIIRHIGRWRGLGVWLALAGGLGLATASGPAAAQPVLEPAEARTQAAAILDHLGVAWAELEVVETERGTTVRVLDPSFTFGEPPLRVELADIAVEMTALEDNTVRFKVTTGTPLAETFTADGRRDTSLTTGRMQVQGLWALQARRIFELHAELAHLELASNDGLAHFAVDRVALDLETPVTAPGRLWAALEIGPMEFQMAGTVLFATEALDLHMEAEGYDPSIDINFRRDYGTSPLGLPAGPLETDAAIRALMGRICADLAHIADSVAFGFSIDGVSGGDLGPVPAGSVNGTLTMEGLRDAATEIRVTFEGHDMDFAALADPPPPDALPFIARDASFSAAWTDAPVAAILTSAASTLANGPQEMDAAGGVMAMQVLWLLARSDLHVVLDDLTYVADGFRAAASGEGRIDPLSAFGSVWSAELELAGLDGLIAVAARSGAPAEVQAMLRVLAEVGQPAEPGPDGLPVLDYALYGDADGSMGINGNDLRPLLGLGRP